MPTHEEIVTSFIAAAPPGQLDNVSNDIKALAGKTGQAADALGPASRKYNENQFATVKLPGSADSVLVSDWNSLGNDRYYDTESQTSFAFDHISRQASAAQSHVLESQHTDLIKSLIKAIKTHAGEHYPSSTIGVYPLKDDDGIVMCLVANKYSLNNFWSGRWRAQYMYKPSSSALLGTINLDVHYFEDGNVRLQTEKKIDLTDLSSSSSASEIVRTVAQAEKRYQTDLNKAFPTLNEDAFKNLRRQLPVTRQKVDWDKISGYRLGQDIAGQTK